MGAAVGAPPPNPSNCRGVASANKPTTGRDFGQAQAALAQQQLRDGANNGLSNCGNSGRRNP